MAPDEALRIVEHVEAGRYEDALEVPCCADTQAVARSHMKLLYRFRDHPGAREALNRAKCTLLAEDDSARGRRLGGLGRFAEAVEPLERALGRRDDVTDGFLLGKALDALGRHEEALQHFRRCAETRGLPVDHHWVGSALIALGRHDEAIAPLERAVELGWDALDREMLRDCMSRPRPRSRKDRGEPRAPAVMVAMAHGAIHALEHIFPVVLPLLLVEFHGNVALFGAIGTAAYITMGLGGLPAGWLADRLGSRRALIVSIGLCSVGCTAVAVAPNAGLVAAALALLGVGLGLYHPAGLSLLSRSYRSFHGRALGIHGVGGAIAIVIAPALFGTVAAVAGWRAAYLLAAIISLVLAIGIALTTGGGEKGEVAPAEAAGSRVEAPSTGKTRGFRWQVIVILLLETACAGLVYRGVTTFLPLYYTREVVPALPGFLVDLLGRGRHGTGAQLAAAIAGTLASVTYASAILGQIWGGRVAGGSRATTWLLAIGIVFTGGLVGIGLASGMPILAFGILFAASYFMAQPITNLMVARYSAGSRHGLVYGVYFTSGFGTGALAPAVAAWIAGEGHLSRVFLLFAIAGLGAIGLRAALLAAARD